jgi:hypothetical protein
MKKWIVLNACLLAGSVSFAGHVESFPTSKPIRGVTLTALPQVIELLFFTDLVCRFGLHLHGNRQQYV